MRLILLSMFVLILLILIKRFMINMKSNQDDVLTGYEDNELYDSKDCEGEEEGKRKAGLLCKWKNV